MNNKEVIKTLKLIQAALQKKDPDDNIFRDTTEQEWEYIYKMACDGAVVSLTFDSVCRLSKEVQPPRGILMRWLALSEQKKEHNRLCEKILCEIQELYEANDIEFILLKGLGIAQLYPHYLLRDGGDIDLFITKGYEKANELLVGRGGVIEESNIKHVHIKYRGISIENHNRIAIISSINNMLLQLFAVERDIIINNHKISVPNDTCNSVYLTEHIAMHFFVGGIGLRHLCDLWLLFHNDNIYYEDFIVGIKKAGSKKIFNALSYILIYKLGLNPIYIPIKPKYDPIIDKLFEEIVTGGNFGMMNNYKPSKNMIIRKAQTMTRMLKRSYTYRSIGGAIYLRQIKELLVFNAKSLLK